MDDAHALPDDLNKCHQLLLAAFREASELERVLDETAASYESLQAMHQAALEELSALKRWIYGRRTKKLVEGDGRLSIDNNVSERTLRHQAIGRKNWLFLGSQQAGPRAAILFTILTGAKRHRIEPWTYLRELLLRLHDDNPRLDEMLPDQWAIQHPEW